MVVGVGFYWKARFSLKQRAFFGMIRVMDKAGSAAVSGGLAGGAGLDREHISPAAAAVPAGEFLRIGEGKQWSI